MPQPFVTRFAPSPTGLLHLGHAFSALTAWDAADRAGGTCLLRIEDIDAARVRPQYEAAIYEDLAWLGLSWPEPVMRQSQRRNAYAVALEKLGGLGLTYPCRCTRADIRAALAAPQETVPQEFVPAEAAAQAARSQPFGPVYPGMCRGRRLADSGPGDAIRLDLSRALDHLNRQALTWCETGPARPGAHSASRRRRRARVSRSSSTCPCTAAASSSGASWRGPATSRRSPCRSGRPTTPARATRPW